MTNSIKYCFSFIALSGLLGCDAEPRFWQEEGYVAGTKPEGTEYLYCAHSFSDSANALLKLRPKEMKATAYEYNSAYLSPVGADIEEYEQFEPDYEEYITELSKSTASSKSYRAKETAWKGFIQGYNHRVYFDSIVLFEPGKEGGLHFTRKFEEFNRSKLGDSLQRTWLEEKAIENSEKFKENSGECEFMPDTESFEKERKASQAIQLEASKRSKERGLEWLRERKEERERVERNKKNSGADRLLILFQTVKANLKAPFFLLGQLLFF